MGCEWWKRLGGLWADQREARQGRRFHQRPFPCIREVFGTARSRQGRAVFARRSEPLTARTVPEGGAEGKGRGGLRGRQSPGGGPGQRPEHLAARGFGARHPEEKRRFRQPRHFREDQWKRGGNGDSSFTARSSRALAAPIFRAHSVSLIRAARRSSCAKPTSGFKYCAASGNDFSFS